MQVDPEIQEKVDRFFSMRRKNMGDALGIRFLSLAKDEIRASMPVNQNTIQPFGILHGGASVALAETLASVGAWLNLEDDGKAAVGLEINANHIRSVPDGGSVTGTARPEHLGRQIQVWEIRIENGQGKLVCSSRCTLAVVESRS